MYTLTGRDDDGDHLVYGIVADMFTVRDPSSGEVYLTKKLDYEVCTRCAVTLLSLMPLPVPSCCYISCHSQCHHIDCYFSCHSLCCHVIISLATPSTVILLSLVPFAVPPCYISCLCGHVVISCATPCVIILLSLMPLPVLSHYISCHCLCGHIVISCATPYAIIL